jgi:outer membrane murein-binding lipoprotein Lpp
MKKTICTLSVSFLLLTGCSSAQQQSAADSVTQLNDACAKVRELNTQVQALNLDDKGQAALDDPKAKALLDEASKATQDLATQLDAKAKADGGKLGELRRKYEDNKKVIGEVASFAKDESKDSLKDKARRLKKVADIVGADNCAGAAK